MSFNDSGFFADAQRRVDQLIESRLTALPQDRLKEAMIYSVLNGGKRIRPLFCYATADIFGSTLLTDDAAVAVELIHAYSLIHDDLPAMDDDDLRRGKATCHLAFDEATAILAGDALQAMAFDILAGDGDQPATGNPVRLALIKSLARAAGAAGMVLGQSIDLCATNRILNLEDLQNMHNNKTGALIDAAVYMGAVSTQQADAADLAALARYSSAIGLAFQVKDDILDVESNTETLGKRQGADAALNKATYSSMLGLTGAKAKLADLHQSAHNALTHFGSEADHLRHIADFIVCRDH